MIAAAQEQGISAAKWEQGTAAAQQEQETAAPKEEGTTAAWARMTAGVQNRKQTTGSLLGCCHRLSGMSGWGLAWAAN